MASKSGTWLSGKAIKMIEFVEEIKRFDNMDYKVKPYL